MSFFKELKERNVFKVAAIYVITGWLLAQVAGLALPTFEAPEWVLRVFLFFLMLGFPIAVIMAWALELTPEGIKRAESSVGEKRIWSIVIMLALAAIAWFEFAAPAAVTEATDVDANDSVAIEAEAPADKTIAVLPFVDLSPTQDQEWFTDGLTEEVLNSLARAPDLLVSSRTSSFAYKNSNKPLTVIAEELGVAHVLEGSVRRAGDKLRVTAQLIRARDGFHLWSENIDGDAVDVIEIQERVATEIAQALETAMDPEALAEMVDVGTRSVKAYELFLQARALVKQADRTGDSSLYDQMLETLKQAIDEDPTFGKAHFSVALFWRGRLELTRQAAKSNSLTLAERYAEFDKAIALAIRHAHNDIERLRYEYLRAWVALDWSLALEKIIAFSEARPAEGCIDLGGVAIRLQRKDIGELAVRNCIEAGKVDIELLQDAVTMSHRVNIDEPIAARLYRANRTRIKNNMAASYQFHRALLWDGEVELARELLPALRSGKGINYRMPILRQACAEGDLDTAREFYELVMTADGDDASSIGEKWLSSQMTGRFDVAEELLRHLDQPDTVFALSSWMYYPQFDPRPYQNLMDMLARNGIEPATPRRETFACPTGVLEP